MSRSPLAYPLTRSADMDSGGAADLQTDIMRFMAILALCLVAIFALVQSLPTSPEPDITPPPVVTEPIHPEPAPAPENVLVEEKTVVLQRPKTVAKEIPERAPVREVEVPTPVPEPVPETDGFTLRFESDHALTRLVASGQIGFYAISKGRAQRMAVSDSRISFWDASTPGSFHEMEATTVPGAVLDALVLTGGPSIDVNWGVTLPGKLQRQLSDIMNQHTGGALVIGTDGNLRREAS